MKKKEKAQETESKKIEKIEKEFQEYVNRAFEKIKFCEGGGNYGIVYTDCGLNYESQMIEILRKKIEEEGNTLIEIEIKDLLEKYGPILSLETRGFNNDLFNEGKKPKNTSPINSTPVIILYGFDKLKIFNKTHIQNMSKKIENINHARKVIGLNDSGKTSSELRNFFNECKINNYKAPEEGTDKYSSFLAYLKLFFHVNGSSGWQDFWESRFPVALFILAPKRIQNSLAQTDGGSDYITRNTLGIFNPENIFN